MRCPYRIFNVKVLRGTNSERELLMCIKKRKTACFGYVVRGEKYESTHLTMENCIQERTGLDKKEMSWLCSISNRTAENKKNNKERDREGFLKKDFQQRLRSVENLKSYLIFGNIALEESKP